MSVNAFNPYTYTNGFKSGDFHHVAISISGTIHTLYLDGIQVAQNISGGNIFSYSSNIKNAIIGASKDRYNAFRGNIGDVRVYNYAINSTQVSNLYLDRNLVNNYKFDIFNKMNIPNYATLIYDASLVGNAIINNNTLYLQNTTNSPTSQYVYAVPPNIPRIRSGLTISAWINTNGIPNKLMRVLDITKNVGYPGISIDISGTNMINSSIENIITNQVTVYNSPAYGTFHHVALTISGNIHTIYYDGSAVAINSNSGNLFSEYSSISNLYIGTTADLINGYSGSIRDVKIYNRSFSSIDISNTITNNYNTLFTPLNYLIDPSFTLWIDSSNISNFTFSSSNIISGVKNISNNSGVMAIGGNTNYAQYFANSSYTNSPFIQIGSYTNTPTSINTNIPNINYKTELTFFWVVALDASFNDPSKNAGYYIPTLYGPDHYSVFANSLNFNNQITNIRIGAGEMGATNNNNASNILMDINDFSANKFQLISFKTSLLGDGQTIGFNGNYTTNPTGFPGGGDTAYNVISSAPAFSNISSPIYLKEVVGFTRSLPTTEFQQIEGYLAEKWRISNQLAINHPYYYS
jgi:hypothetical protein